MPIETKVKQIIRDMGDYRGKDRRNIRGTLKKYE